jgi:hypothetical protein
VVVASIAFLCVFYFFTAYPRKQRCFRGAKGDYSTKKNKKPAPKQADFSLRVFPRERRYAELSYLLPVYLRPTVKNPVCRPFLLARQLLIAYCDRDALTMPQVAGSVKFPRIPLAVSHTT